MTERELRVASRHRKTYRLRVRAVGISLLLGATLYGLLETLPGAFLTPRGVFEVAAFGALMFCAATGITQTVDCLSSEKREGTLGLLFLTDLKAYDIVLGKLLASSLAAFYALLGVIPVFALVLLLGGVRMSEFIRVVLNFVLTLWFSLCLGLLVSAGSRNFRKASSVASIAMLVFLVGLPALGEFLRRKWMPHSLITWVEIWSPVYTHARAIDPFAGFRNDYYWLSVGCRSAFSAVLFGLACWILPGAWRDRSLIPRRKLRDRLRSGRFHWAPVTRFLRTRNGPLDSNPFCWLTIRLARPAIGMWFLIMAVPIGVAVAAHIYGANRPVTANCATMGGTLLLLGLVVTVASEACQRFAEDRHSGAMELLLSTPLSERLILRGHWMAMGRKFGTVTLAVLCVTAMLLAWFAPEPEYWFAFGVLLANLAFVLVGLVWVGMWMSLRLPQANHASAAAFWRLLLLPIPILIATSVLPTAWDRPPLDSPIPWACGFSVNSILFSVWARQRLYRCFRKAAMRVAD